MAFLETFQIRAPTRSAGAEAPPLGRQFSFTARKPLPPSLPTTENEGRQPQIERTRATTELLVDLYKENDPPGSPVYAEHPVLIDAEDEHEEKVYMKILRLEVATRALSDQTVQNNQAIDTTYVQRAGGIQLIGQMDDHLPSETKIDQRV